MDYNKEEVTYCNNCHSLHITLEQDNEFCNKCQSINNTSQCSIREWLEDEKVSNT